MSPGALAKAQAGGYGGNDMRLDLHGDGRGRPGCELGIENSGDEIRALCWKGWGGIEQTEIARMGEMYDARLHLRDDPGERLLEVAGFPKIERGKFAAERGHGQRRRD